MADFGNPFSGLDLNKTLNKDELTRALRFTIAAEFEAVQLYMQIAKATDDLDARKVLQDIADEELVHAGEFLALVKKLNPDEEKLYQKGESEVADLLKQSSTGIEAYQSIQALDKIAASIEQDEPKLALYLDALSDKIEASIQKVAMNISKQDIQKNRFALVEVLKTVREDKRRPLIDAIQFLMKLETQI